LKPSLREFCNELNSSYASFVETKLPKGEKTFDTYNYSATKIREAAIDPVRGNMPPGAIHEATIFHQAYLEGIVVDYARPSIELAKNVPLDFIVITPESPYPKFGDAKAFVSDEVLKSQNQTMNMEQEARIGGAKAYVQKDKFCGQPGGPQSPEDVIHVIDLTFIPSGLKEIFKKLFLEGASEAGSDKGMYFINDKDK